MYALRIVYGYGTRNLQSNSTLLITRNGLRIKVRNPRNYDVTTANQNARNVENLEMVRDCSILVRNRLHILIHSHLTSK